MADRVPDNAMLSHDLFEGIFARAGLVTDVELFDEFPSNYLVSAARQHRWARGDWQLLPWIVGRARDATGRRSRTGLPGIARWKMIDNLRRSLSAPLTLATLVAAWTLPSVSAGIWSAFVLAALDRPAGAARPGGTAAATAAASRSAATSGPSARTSPWPWPRWGSSITLLAHQAWLMVDAIVRTLARLIVTRRSLLEWTTAAQAKASHDLEPRRVLPPDGRRRRDRARRGGPRPRWRSRARPGSRRRSSASGCSRRSSPGGSACRPANRPPSSSRPRTRAALRLTARRTWRFFETFVTPAEHALPPDNFQDDPEPLIAHRTSPTNIGMYLLATVTARDLGWIGTLEMVERLEATLATIARLERFRGHLYNWYDTRDLHRLEPAYVSSVDSGNLVGHLLTLSNACRQMIDQPLPLAAALAGIGDAIALTRQAAGAIGDERRSQTLTRRHLDEALEAPRRPTPTCPRRPRRGPPDWAGSRRTPGRCRTSPRP